MIPLSYSRMADMACPHRFAAKYIHKTFVEPENDAMRIGSAVHSSIEQYLKHCFATKQLTDLAWFENASFPEDIADRCRSLLDDFKSMAPAAPLDARWWAVELKRGFDAKLFPLDDKNGGWMHKDVAFRSIVDYAYVHGSTLYVVDWKTGRGDPDPEQAKIYAHLAYKMAPPMDMAGVTRVAVVWGMIAKGKMVRAGEWELGDTVPLGVPILEAIETVNGWTEFPAVACDLCTAYGGCKVPDCPLRSDAKAALVAAVPVPEKDTPKIRLPEKLEWEKDAQDAVLFIQFAEDLIDRLKGLLRHYVEQNGPVTAGGKKAELRPNNPWKAKDLQQLLGVLVKYGVPKDQIFSAVSLTESNLEKLLKKNRLADRLPLLLSMGERKEYKPRFGIYNLKGDDGEVAV